jgi:hypothetical protein
MSRFREPLTEPSGLGGREPRSNERRGRPERCRRVR